MLHFLQTAPIAANRPMSPAATVPHFRVRSAASIQLPERKARTFLSHNTPQQCGVQVYCVSPLYDISEGIGSTLSLAYLGTLLSVLLVAAYTVVQQVVERASMDETVKKLGDTIRAGNAKSEDYFQLGSVLTRKKLYLQAIKNFEKAINVWKGPESDLAEVYNAMGYAYFRLEKTPSAIQKYQKAVQLQPTYVVAWNNLGDAYESTQEWKNAYEAYKQALSQESENNVAKERSTYLKGKLDRLDIKV